MPDDKLVPVTLETIAQQLGDFRKEFNGFRGEVGGFRKEFDDFRKEVDLRFDQTATSIKSELRVEIEAVRENVKRVYDAVVAQQAINKSFLRHQARLEKRVDNHDLRILALEHPKTS
jgi:hypothetical protein